MHLSTKTNVPFTYMPRTFQLSSHAQTIFWNKTTMHLPIIMPCTPYRATHNYMLDLSFSTYYDVAKLQLVCGDDPIIQTTYKNVAQFSLLQLCCLGNRLCSSFILPWEVLLQDTTIILSLSSHYLFLITISWTNLSQLTNEKSYQDDDYQVGTITYPVKYQLLVHIHSLILIKYQVHVSRPAIPGCKYVVHVATSHWRGRFRMKLWV